MEKIKMNNKELVETIKTILIEILEISDGPFNFDTPLNELGLDSLDTVELITRVETEFEIRLPSNIYKIIKNGNDIVAYLEKNIKND